MWRHYDRESIDRLLEKIRTLFPSAFIRTSFIIGFPGETDEDLETLLDFIEENRFESVGLFQYHDEPLAPSSRLPDKIDDAIARSRLDRVVTLLERIYHDHTEKAKGKIFSGYIMEIEKKGKEFIIRREIQAPEIDEYDRVKKGDIRSWELQIGSFVEYKK